LSLSSRLSKIRSGAHLFNFMGNNSIFFNEAGRLRSGWRFSIFLLSYLLFTGVFGVGLIAVMSNLPIGFSPNSLLAFVVPFAVFGAIAIFLGWFFGKAFEDLPFRALGCSLTKNWLKDLVFGLIIGAASFGFAALVAAIFGGLRFEFNAKFRRGGDCFDARRDAFDFHVRRDQRRSFVSRLSAANDVASASFLVRRAGHFGFIRFGTRQQSERDFFFVDEYFFGWNLARRRLLENQNFVVSVRRSPGLELDSGRVFGNKRQRIVRFGFRADFQTFKFNGNFFHRRRLRHRGRFRLHARAYIFDDLNLFLPFLRPTAEMLALTNQENPKLISESSTARLLLKAAMNEF
jgi:hypothetical protein